MSQREVARTVGTSRGVIGRIEAGTLSPSSAMLVRVFSALGCRVTVVDRDGRELVPMGDDAARDAVGRHYPSHLDVFEVQAFGQWWHDKWCIIPEARRPEHSFYLLRETETSSSAERADDERVPIDRADWGRCSSGSHVVLERRGLRDPRYMLQPPTSMRYRSDPRPG